MTDKYDALCKFVDVKITKLDVTNDMIVQFVTNDKDFDWVIINLKGISC